MSSLARLFVSFPLVLAACGGSVDRVPDPNGSSADGTRSPSSSSSSSSSGGGSSGTCTLAPACEKGDRSFATSEAACQEIAGVSCYSRSACGRAIWCQHTDVGDCAAFPTCKPGWVEVKSCVPDSECEKVTLCNQTIVCQYICEGPQPICDAGDTQVASQSECLQDDAKCYSRTSCNVTIWCTGPE